MSTTDSLERVRAQFQQLGESPAASEPDWLAGARGDSLERFLGRGFPTTRDEDWRFTSVASLVGTEFSLPATGSESDASSLRGRLELPEVDAHELVFVNGRFSPQLSSVGALPGGAVVESLSQALSRGDERLEALLHRERAGVTPFFDLNGAFVADGAFVHLPPGTALERPVHLLFLTTTDGSVVHPRNVVLAERSSELRLVETYAGADDASYWTNAVTEIAVEDGAVVDHYKLQLEGSSAYHVSSLDVVQGRSAQASNHSLSLGAKLSRHDVRAELGGEGADATLNGLYVVAGSQHVDHHTTIDHKVPHGTSRELYKGVLDDASSGVFNGRVIVRQDAQKTDSQQSNRNLLLSKDALVNTNPQLEIHADDVKCAHGATIGQLDADMMFYLQSRGIAPDQARTILTEGFMADIADRIRIGFVRDALRKRLFGMFGSGA